MELKDFLTKIGSVRTVSGDIMNSPDPYIMQQVNTLGTMGAGLAKQIRADLTPEEYAKYVNISKQQGASLLGKTLPLHSASNPNRTYLNIFGQSEIGRDPNRVYTDYDALEQAFTNIANKFPEGTAISMPVGMGAGLANGDWDTIESLADRILGSKMNLTKYKFNKEAIKEAAAIAATTEDPVTRELLIKKVISGGQTGADILGLQLAKQAGIPTGGTIGLNSWGKPLIEYNDGINRSKFNMDTIPWQGSVRDSYVNRTNLNAANADGTVYFRGFEMGPGLFATQRAARQANKPFLDNPQDYDSLLDWVRKNNVQTINIAGNRGSTFAPDTKNRETDLLTRLFKELAPVENVAPIAQTVAAVTPDPTDDAIANAFTVGSTLTHPKFGLGTVTGITGDIVDVNFNGTTKHMGLKWLYDNVLNK